jgi:aspartyl-tRNA(Asn)/glutamyl-tRNA(Gln) amidotransferase subunit C
MTERLERVHRVAKLAAVSLGDDEAEELADDLDRILAYFSDLDGIDTTDVAPTAQVQPLTQTAWRTDELTPCLDHEEALAAAPRVENDGFAVPAFMDVP